MPKKKSKDSRRLDWLARKKGFVWIVEHRPPLQWWAISNKELRKRIDGAMKAGGELE